MEKLLDNQFWNVAFDRDAPFYDSYVNYFSKAILEKNPAVLDIHREAIYYIKDEALAPIVIDLLLIAQEYPDSGFVESLAYFLSSKDQEARLKAVFSNMGPKAVAEINSTIDALCNALLKTDDSDLVDELVNFQSMIS